MAHFLSDVVGRSTPFGLRIERRGVWLASSIEMAGDSKSRKQGLLGRDALAPGSGLVIAPSQGIHTFGMRFPLDIVCVARDGRVVKYRPSVAPRRIVLAFSAFAILELASGETVRAGLQVGERLIVDLAV